VGTWDSDGRLLDARAEAYCRKDTMWA
jgi:hypothetical protein